MEMRYEPIFATDVVYKMTLEELVAQEYKKEEHILACLRHIGVDNVRVILPATPPKNIMCSPIRGIAICSGEKVDTICKMVNLKEDLYNPLVEGDGIHKGHWYHPYKITFTPVEYEGVYERLYFSDFCSMLRDGHAKIIRSL